VDFHPSPHFSISFEILNEAKLIHLYVNGYSCKIDPALNVLPLKSILVMMVYYFFVLVVFLNTNLWNWVVVIRELIKCQIFPIVRFF
jgi:hypothetical protein